MSMKVFIYRAAMTQLLPTVVYIELFSEEKSVCVSITIWKREKNYADTCGLESVEFGG